MKVYCQECGSPHEYSTKKPNFCQNCGNSFITSKASDPANKTKLTKNEDYDEEESDEEYNEEDGGGVEASVPQMGALDVEIQMPSKTKISLKDVMGTAQAGEENIVRDHDEPLSQKDFLDSFRREAGAIKPQSRKKKGEST